MTEISPFTKSQRFDNAVLTRKELARSIGQLIAQINDLHPHDGTGYVLGARNALLTLADSWRLDPEEICIGERREWMRIRLRKAGAARNGRES